MTKQVSAGVIFVDPIEEKILMIHPTNQQDYWDFPKGRVEKGETTLEAAIREVGEETGMIVSDENVLNDLGFYRYNQHKNIHMYSCFDKHVNIEDLFCDVLIEDVDNPFPECDDFKMFSIDEAIDLMCPSMKKVFVYDLEPQIRFQMKKAKTQIELDNTFNQVS